jgi:hypothetical protein
MLIKISKDSILNALKYATKIPLANKLLHKTTELIKGKRIIYFSIHRILPDTITSLVHPHYVNGTALTIKQAEKQLVHINRILPFISFSDSLALLTGKKPMTHSCSVLIVEIPYFLTMELFLPLLSKMNIPLAIAIDTKSIKSGYMPWMDELVFRLGHTQKTQLAVNFMDRQYSLTTMSERLDTARNLIAYLGKLPIEILLSRLQEIRDYLFDVSILTANERILSSEQLKKLSLEIPLSFLCAGENRLPLTLMSKNEVMREVILNFHLLRSLFMECALPVYFSHFYFDKKKRTEFLEMMIGNQMSAAISANKGLAKSGDDMFCLCRYPLAQELGEIEKFEFMGLSEAIDELILVTLAREEREE